MIMAVEWNESMKTGVDSIDNQHKEMFLQVAKLKEAIDQQKNRSEIGRIIDTLSRYAMRHFAEEELWMEKQNCPSAEANKQAHDEFIADWKQFKEQFDSEGADKELLQKLLMRTQDWIKNHILKIDLQLKATVKERGF